MNKTVPTIEMNPIDDIQHLLEESGCYESEVEMMKTAGTYDAFVRKGSDEEDWFAAASFSPRSDNDGSKHPVFVDDGFGKPVPASDVIQNRDGEFSSRCSTSKELFDFNVKVAQNR